jgi:hypothetical protein
MGVAEEGKYTLSSFAVKRTIPTSSDPRIGKFYFTKIVS